MSEADQSPASKASRKAEAKAESRADAKSAGAFRTIGEVADSLGLAQHVLRFWEKKFHQVRPVKRNGGRRYYRVEDIEMLREIRSLLHDQGYTIRGVQKLLREGGLAQEVRARATGKATRSKAVLIEETAVAPVAAPVPMPAPVATAVAVMPEPAEKADRAEKTDKTEKGDKAAKKVYSEDLRQVAMPFDLLQDMSGMRQAIKTALAELEALHAELAARQSG